MNTTFKQRLFLGLCTVFGLLWFFFLDIIPLSQGTPELELVLKEVDPIAQRILVELTIRNIGSQPLSLPRITEQRLRDYFIWGGWALHIENSHGELFGYGQHEGIFFWKPHVIRLQPGSSFSIIINVADAKRITRFEEENTSSPPELARIPGEYHVSVRLNLSRHTIPPYLRNTVWKGSLESNTTLVVIDK